MYREFSIRSIHAVPRSMRSARPTRNSRRDMPSLALVGLIVRDTASSGRTALSTCSGVNGESVNGLLIVMWLTDVIRYCNMDFALMSTLMLSFAAGITRFLISYDIACQWHKHLQERLNWYNSFPPLLLAALKYWMVAVPKFHLPGHGNECQLKYNLAYTKWAGRMDGERIEAGWAQTIPMATWTRESGPYARRAILDDHWNASNWRKVLGLREYPQSSYLPLWPDALLQARSSTGIFGDPSHGAKLNGTQQTSCLRASQRTSSTSGARCGKPSTLTPPIQTHTRKPKIVRFLQLITPFPSYSILRSHHGRIEAGASQGGSKASPQRGGCTTPYFRKLFFPHGD